MLLKCCQILKRHGAETHGDVLPQSGETLILKNQINCFHDTELKNILDANGIKDVVICGAMSHMCVDAATRAASDFGFACTLVHDACATLDLEFDGVTVPAKLAHAAYMSALGFAYANAVSTDQYLSEAA